MHKFMCHMHTKNKGYSCCLHNPASLFRALSTAPGNRCFFSQGNLTNADEVSKACEGADCVWHVAALVGPFHAKEAYMAVNYHGSLNVLEACRY